EGLADDGKLHPIPEAFVQGYGLQCGYCTPGMVLAAHYLLGRNPDPTEEEIRKGLGGNLCMCTGYMQIVEAVKEAAKEVNR
ncbi:MAG: (2Fe-2S)-binding protein, partial [Deltaproteobacteria bacterium]|nr:(2Fe-2S)-binding protein [Deltaproteobacteria bacterium]